MGIMRDIQLEQAQQEYDERMARLEREHFEAYGVELDGESIEALEWALDKDD